MAAVELDLRRQEQAESYAEQVGETDRARTSGPGSPNRNDHGNLHLLLRETRNSGFGKLQFPDDANMRLSHETIYRSLHVQDAVACGGSWSNTCGPGVRSARLDARPNCVGAFAGMVGVARSVGSARGFTNVVVVCDEAQAMSDEDLEALGSATSAAPLGDQQKIYTGTPPGPKGQRRGLLPYPGQAPWTAPRPAGPGTSGRPSRTTWTTATCGRR